MSLDGSTFAPPTLPAPGGPATAFFPSAGAPQPQPGTAVGRPAADPLVQEQRNSRYAEDKRIRAALSKSADSKFWVFPTKNGRVKTGQRPTIKVLVRDVERYLAECGTPDAETNDYLKEKLAEKGVVEGNFQCQVYDSFGKRNLQYPVWELSLSDEVDDPSDPVADESNDESTLPDFMADQRPDPYAQPAPPPPPQIDPLAIARTIDQGRADESQKSSNMMGVMMTVLQTMNAQQTAAQQQAIQQQNMMMEREASRRSDTLKAIIAAVPLILPMILPLFNKEAKPDQGMLMVIEMMKAQFANKPDTAVMFEQMSKMMGLSMESTMKAQSNMTESMARMQLETSAQTAKVGGEIQGMLISNVLKTMKELNAERNPVAKEPSMMETIASVAGPIIAGMQQQKAAETQAAAAAAAANPQQARVAPPVQQRPPAPLPPPATARGAKRPPPAQQPPPAVQAAMTPESRISGCLKDVMALHNGRIPANKYWGLADWVGKTLPPDMITAIKAKDEITIMLKGTPVVEMKGNEALKGWFNDPASAEFLRLFLSDVGEHLNGTMTEALAGERVKTHAAYIKQKMANVGAGAAAASTAALVAEVVPNPGSPEEAETPAPAGEAAPAEQAQGGKKKRPPPKKDNGLI